MSALRIRVRPWPSQWRWLPSDPRLWQITVLGALLVYGLGWLDFDVPIDHVIAILATVLVVQLAGTLVAGLPRFDPRSALISGLSLCLLLRTNDPGLAILGATVAIASKFVLRSRGKHVFNPTNFALVVMMLATNAVWVSPGQWGSAAFFGFLLACAGGLAVNRAARSDITWTFLAVYATIVIGRSLWLGDTLSVPLHRLRSGALVLFAYFMISDPKTTPSSRAGRILFAVLVAAGAGVIQFALFWPNALLWSLAVWSPVVPVIDSVLPGARYEWAGHREGPRPARGGTPGGALAPNAEIARGAGGTRRHVRMERSPQ